MTTLPIVVPGTEEKDPKKIIMPLQQLVPRFETAEATLAVISSGQIPFPATQNPSADANTLDDYEEGTWTPVLTFSTPGDLTVAYSLRSGYYTKIGRLVSASFVVLASTFTYTTASGNLVVNGLPFTAVNDASYRSFAPLIFSGINKASYQAVSAILNGNATQLGIYASGMGQTVTTVVAADAPTTSAVILGGTVNYVV